MKKYIVLFMILVLGLILINYELAAEEKFDEKVKAYLVEKQAIKTNNLNIDILSLSSVKNYKDYEIHRVVIDKYPLIVQYLILEKMIIFFDESRFQ